MKKRDLIQTFIIIDKMRPQDVTRKDLFEMMTRDKKAVAASKDFPLFAEKYPSLIVEFVKAICLD